MNLSLCMIVKNEEQALPRCLDSVKAIVDEIIIVDTGSTDRTVEIARSFGAQVSFFEWCNDFSVARNVSLQQAQGDWILVLDADEVLVPNVIPLLQQAIQQQSYLLINLVRQEVGAEQSPYSLISRLFRKHPDITFRRPYHAMVDDSVAEILSREPHWQVVNFSEVAILHEGYQATAIAGRDKFAKAQAAMAGFLAAHPDDPYVCNKLGALYLASGDLTQGVGLLERGLKSAQADPPILYELHYHLGIAYSQLQNLTQAEFHYQSALQQSLLPRLKLGAYLNLGSLLKNRGDLVGAEAAFRTSLEVEPSFALAHYNLGLVLKARGQLREAIAAYQQAIQLNPLLAEAYQNLGVALLKTGNLPASLSAFQQAIGLYEQQGSPEAERLRQGLEELGLKI